MVIPLPSPTTTAGAISRTTLRAGPVFTRCGVTRRLFGITKLRFSCLASRKNRRRRGRGRNGNRPSGRAYHGAGQALASTNRKPVRRAVEKSTRSMAMNKKIAVILSGCGVYDGSEIYESVATLLRLDQRGATVQCFAPNIPQLHVINHMTGEEMPETRNVLVE